MLKLMIFGRRAPGKSRRAALDHLRLVHGRMVLCPPADAGAMPVRYVQNHVIDGVYASGGGARGIERDLVTEIWFDDFDHLRASTATAYYCDTLQPDEPNFVDDGSVEKLLVRTEVILEGERGTYKAFLAVASGSDALDDALRSARGIGGAARNLVLPPLDGSAPFVASIYEAWFETPEDAYALVEAFAASPQGHMAGNFALVAEQFDAARLAAQYQRQIGSPT